MSTAVSSLTYPPFIASTGMYRPYIVSDTVSATPPLATETDQVVNLTPSTKCTTTIPLTNDPEFFDHEHEQPASRETSVKAKPGSIMAMSEFSKKVDN